MVRHMYTLYSRVSGTVRYGMAYVDIWYNRVNGMVQYGVVWCRTIWYGMCVVWDDDVPYDMVCVWYGLW